MEGGMSDDRPATTPAAARPPRLEILSPGDLDAIHAETLTVLEQTGVFVEDDEALDIFADGGAAVDRETRMVRIPGEVVEATIASCPKDDGGPTTFSNFDEGVMYVDPRSGERREPVKADAADAALLVDALANIDSYAAAVRPGDVPAATAAVHGCEAALLSTSKPVGAEATTGWEVRACAELGACLVGDLDALRQDPVVTFGTCPVSPLKLPRDACEVIIEASRLGLPDCILSMAMSGGTAPVTLAGTLVVHNAEVLSGVALAQLTERGVPVTYGSSTTSMDLRFAAASVGSPELALIGAAVAQMSKQYRLPSCIAGA
jgi:trimethylamine---corrinoid protein Co-methyltransferase